MFYKFNQLDQLVGRGFAAGFLLHRRKNVQLKALGEIGKAVMEGHQFPALKAG